MLRLRQLAQVLERHEAHRLRVQQLMRLLLQEADAVSLLVDFGLAPRNAFGSELAGRLRAKLLPGASDTRNGAELFALVFRAEDAHWLARLDAPTRARLAALCPPLGEAWRAALMDAITMLCSAVRAAGFSSALRLRMGTDVRAVEPFRQLARAADSFSTALRTGDAAERARAQRQLQRLLAQCRAAADAVLEHLEEYGVSLHIHSATSTNQASFLL